jgi:hypothetical protein
MPHRSTSELPGLPYWRALELVERMSLVNVLVVGDAMLDHFIVGRVTRITRGAGADRRVLEGVLPCPQPATLDALSTGRPGSGMTSLVRQ